MAHSASVALLCSFLKPANDARPTFLFGAGASFSSGIPLASESVKRLAKQAYADRVLGGKTLPEQIKMSEWMAWLQGQKWFIHGDDRLAENFPLVIEHELRPEAYRRTALLDLVALKQDLGVGYRATAELVLRGLAGTVLTTNFDICLPKALNDKQPHIRHVAEVNRAPNDFNEFSPFARAQIDGKKRRIFAGNLIGQYKAVLEWFEQEQVNPAIRVKGRRQHETRSAYPERALVELLVNMIVHRDFSIAKPSQINVVLGHSVRFVNPGAPLPAAAGRLALGPDGAFQPVPQFSDLRNRALCDVFFGISAMERAGTGLTDACELAAELGGAATFAYPPGQDCFVAELFRLGASAGLATVARDTRPVGTYVLNLLPFAATPQSLTHIPLRVSSWDELEKKAPLSEAGTFVFEWRTGDLWSFMPEVLVNTLFAVVAKGPARTVPLEEVDKDRVLQSKFSWLTRRHFENHLKRFESRGLIIEKDKKGHPARRAYFTALKGNNRTITYDTPHRKGVRRDVVKRRGEDYKTWFECEGFGYEVVRQANVWGIRIKPFYMFAKRDGVSPLPGYMRTSKATRRIKFDRNANVESDLTFWARFLSQGSQTINIGSRHVDDLLLEGSFATVDVQEGGLIDGSATQDRRFA